MNCKSIRELLPLYVSRDLEEGRMRQVTAHIHSCAECGDSAAEYREAQRLLEEFAPPAFSEGVYAGIRQRVLREIEASAPAVTTSPFERLIDGWFRPRLGWAVASVLLLAICLTAFYFIAKRGNDNRELAVVVPKDSTQVPNPTASKSPSMTTTGEAQPLPIKIKNSNDGAEDRKAGTGARRPKLNNRPEALADRAPVMAGNILPQPSINSEGSSAGNQLETETIQSPERVLRMEMQTKDPNIRIIWLTPQRTKQDSPGKVSKGV